MVSSVAKGESKGSDREEDLAGALGLLVMSLCLCLVPLPSSQDWST